MRHWRFATYILILLFVTVGPVEAADQIGVATAVKNEVTGTISGQSRDLSTGNGVFLNEAIATAAASSAQLLFIDKTNLTVGQKSRVVLDRFVYDPSRSSSEVLLNATSGAFRFISGAVERKSYRLKVPGGTIGIRGTIVEVYIDDRNCPPGAGPQPEQECRISCAVLIEGAFTLEPDNPNRRDIPVDRSGDFVCILPDGSTIGPQDWTGPIRNLDAGQQFFANYVENVVLGDSSPGFGGPASPPSPPPPPVQLMPPPPPPSLVPIAVPVVAASVPVLAAIISINSRPSTPASP